MFKISMLRRFFMAAVVMSGLFLVAGMVSAGDVEKASEAPQAEYPVDFCVVSGEKLGSMGDPVKYDHDGREVQFCCKMCIKKFESDSDTYIEKLDAAIIEAQKENYPLETCVVSDEKLGSMGDPVNLVYDNQLVQLCCKMCKKDFEKDPAKYMSMVAEARSDTKEQKVEKKTGHEGHNH